MDMEIKRRISAETIRALYRLANRRGVSQKLKQIASQRADNEAEKEQKAQAMKAALSGSQEQLKA